MFHLKKCELYVKLTTLILIRNVKLDSCNPAEFGFNFILLFLEFTLKVKFVSFLTAGFPARSLFAT